MKATQQKDSALPLIFDSSDSAALSLALWSPPQEPLNLHSDSTAFLTVPSSSSFTNRDSLSTSTCSDTKPFSNLTARAYTFDDESDSDKDESGREFVQQAVKQNPFYERWTAFGSQEPKLKTVWGRTVHSYLNLKGL
jgi:hypothetical protein